MKLNEKVYIITGATSGMGRAIALEFAREGAKLLLNGRDEKRGGEVMDRINQQGGDAHFVPGDVCLESINVALTEEAISRFGKIDGISTNAGMLGLGEVTTLNSSIWEKTFQTNVDSVFYLMKHSLPYMKQIGTGVVLVNASIAAFKQFPNHPAYCASKAATVALAKQAAADYGPQIRINAICPGPVDTPFLHDSAVAFPDPETAINNAANGTFMKRLGTPGDVAKLALFLASDDASWITGAAYRIDGGIITG
ncbi:MAG: SDR family oxidoreductase [Balneolaceae bacterium]|nr:MAG: SDR family oxidoreductase [Balneolaceae bacterium]